MSTLASSSWPSFPSYLGPHRITPSHVVHISELSFDDVPIFDPIRDKRARDDHTEQADERDPDTDSIIRPSSTSVDALWTTLHVEVHLLLSRRGGNVDTPYERAVRSRGESLL